MRLKIMLPTGVLVDEDVRKVTAEAGDGEITLLERHADLATTVVPGVLTFEPAGGGEEFVAVAEGTLVKCGGEVLVSTRRAARGRELGRLRDQVERQSQALDAHEEAARTALAKMEAAFVHRFIEIEHGAR